MGVISERIHCTLSQAADRLVSCTAKNSTDSHTIYGISIRLLGVQMCRADIQTCCFGLAASMGAFILGAGAKGKRSSMPNARIMIHQPLGGASGQVHCLSTLFQKTLRTKIGEWRGRGRGGRG